MKEYSKISVLAMSAALGTTVFFGASASAQQYSPVSVDNSVQVNWDVADGYGDQPTVPQYLSPSVSREHVVMPGGDLIYPETKPKSAFLASNQFAASNASEGDSDGFETVVIDGAGSANGIPTRSEFYGVPGVSASASMDDGANQVIALQQPEPTAAPRSKPVVTKTEVASTSASTNAPPPLAKPTPAPAAPTMVAAPTPAPTPAPVPAPVAAPVTETAEAVEPPKAPPLISEESAAPAAPSASAVEPIASNNEVPPAPAPSPDTTQSAPAMAQSAPMPKAEPAPPVEQAAVPPANTPSPTPMPAGSGDEYSLGFAADSFELSETAKRELNQVIAAMGKDDSLRIQLQAYAQGDGANASKARRLSLSRALQVRSYLIDQGVRSTRIDVRALGSNVPSGPADRVDIKTVQR
ncbi:MULTISPECIES: OmpA family protein [Thalassospira]|uniref:Lysophospholipase n=2 Tax=Thalassospira TaxID=168934 RepID=A0A367W6Q4_9PROT|nr:MULTISPECIES: OmpA family protein [Thalassospira]MDG4719166.1 OmpA family protein [Thalassospira sp. FZY0004]RCK37093.1 lysophospholipase [Thalassospira profundimaris]